MNHPSTEPDPDDTDAALIRRVAARQSAALGRPIPTDLDPAAVRRQLAADRDAMAIAVGVLNRDGCTVPAAVDAALEGKPTIAAYDVPPGVAGVILERVGHHAPEVFGPLGAELDRFAAQCAAQPGAIRELAELCCHRLADATRGVIGGHIAADVAADYAGQVDPTTGQPFEAWQVTQAAEAVVDMVALPAILERLRDDLAAMAPLPSAHAGPARDDPGFETRCRRASVVNMLAQLRGDAQLQEEAVRLALVECGRYGDLRPSDVFRVGSPVLLLPADASPGDIESALVAELAAIAGDDNPTGAP